MSKRMKASDYRCCECGKKAVAFFPVFDPDVPAYPYCRSCLDKAKTELVIKLIDLERNEI